LLRAESRKADVRFVEVCGGPRLFGCLWLCPDAITTHMWRIISSRPADLSSQSGLGLCFLTFGLVQTTPQMFTLLKETCVMIQVSALQYFIFLMKKLRV